MCIDPQFYTDKNYYVYLALNTNEFDVRYVSGLEKNLSYNNGVVKGYKNVIKSAHQHIVFNVRPKNRNNTNLQPIKKYSLGGAEIPDINESGRYLSSISLVGELLKANPIPEIKDNRYVIKDGNEYLLTIENMHKLYKAEFYKVNTEKDENDRWKVLPGAVFELKAKDGKPYKDPIEGKIATATSDKDGKVRFFNLKPGSYQIIETITPDGYKKPEGAVKEFIIEKDGTVKVNTIEGLKTFSDSHDAFNIVNLKPGDGKFKIVKTNGTGDKLIGVEFELYNSTGKVTINGKDKFITNEHGEIIFENLPYDQYYVKEIKTLPGYVLDSELKVVMVGKKWKKFSPTGKDVSNSLELIADKSEMHSIIGNDNYITPNNSEVIEANLKYKVAEGSNIQPGDIFRIAASDNVDLDGIGKSNDDEYDIYGPAGLLATAKISDNRREITYTFTEYAKYYNIRSINIGILMAVNRIKVPGDKQGKANIDVDVNLGKSKCSSNFDVQYTYSDDVQVNACLVKYIEGTNNFEAYFYVNHNHENTYGKKLIFTSNSQVEFDSIQSYRLDSYNQNLPWSFGEPEKNPEYNLVEYRGYTNEKNGFQLSINDDYPKYTYLVKVSGKVTKVNRYKFALYCTYYWNNGYYNYVQNVGLYKSLKNTESNAEADIVLTFKNYKNKIEYTKVDGSISGTAIDTKQEGKTEDNNKQMSVPRPMFSSQENPLQGAKFVLKKDGSDTALDKSERISDTNGKFGWEGLAPGKYEVWETETPSEYSKPNNPVSSFEVNDKGEIVVTSKDNTTTIKNYKKPDIEFKKVDGKKVEGQNAQVPLAYAVFTLRKAKTNKDGSFVRNSGKLLEFEDVMIEVEVNGKKDNIPYTATSDANGLFNFKKLEDGIYAVKETKAPKDYAMLLDYALIFKVEGGKIYEVNKAGKYVDKDKNEVPDKTKANLLVDIETGKAEVKPIQIENFKVEYPATGGVGTLPFVFIGMMIMMVGAYMFIRRRDALYE